MILKSTIVSTVTESEQVSEQALDELMKFNTAPWVFLATTGLTNAQLLKTCKVFGLKIHGKSKILKSLFSKVSSPSGLSKNSSCLLYMTNESLNHKEKTIQLFFAALYASKVSPKSAFCLGQYDVLGARLKESEKKLQNIKFNEKSSEDFKRWIPQSGYIHLSESIRHYLSQIELNFANNNVHGPTVAQQLVSYTNIKTEKFAG